MRNARKLGLVGRVILGVGSVGGLVSASGCDAVVGGYIGHKLAERTASKRETNIQQEPIERKLYVQYWKDYNNNGRPDGGEILGDVESSINLDEYGLVVSLQSPGRIPTGYLTFFALDSEGNRISYSEDMVYAYHVSNKSDKTTDFLETLNHISKSKPGEYVICAQQGRLPEIYKKTITIERNSNIDK